MRTTRAAGKIVLYDYRAWLAKTSSHLASWLAWHLHHFYKVGELFRLDGEIPFCGTLKNPTFLLFLDFFKF